MLFNKGGSKTDGSNIFFTYFHSNLNTLTKLVFPSTAFLPTTFLLFIIFPSPSSFFLSLFILIIHYLHFLHSPVLFTVQCSITLLSLAAFRLLMYLGSPSFIILNAWQLWGVFTWCQPLPHNWTHINDTQWKIAHCECGHQSHDSHLTIPSFRTLTLWIQLLQFFHMRVLGIVALWV